MTVDLTDLYVLLLKSYIAKSRPRDSLDDSFCNA